MAKPSQLPRWATGAGAPVTPEPSEGKKDSGWAASEKPPHQYFNWWMNLVYQWVIYLDGITNEALTWAAKHTFGGGLATPVAPTAGDDVANKTYVDLAIDTDVAAHNGVTNPHLATSAAAADRLVLRDAAGRAKVADGAAADDIATKGQVDAGGSVSSSTCTLATGLSGTYGNAVVRSGRVVNFSFGLSSSQDGVAQQVATLPVGFRPSSVLRLVGLFYDNSAATRRLAYFDVGTDGVVQLTYVDDGANLTNGFLPISTNDQIHLSGTFLTA